MFKESVRIGKDRSGDLRFGSDRRWRSLSFETLRPIKDFVLRGEGGYAPLVTFSYPPRRRISPTPPSFRAPLPRSQTCVETAVPSILVQHYLIVSSRTCVLHWCPIHAQHTRAPWPTLSRPRPTPMARPPPARSASGRGRA